MQSHPLCGSLVLLVFTLLIVCSVEARSTYTCSSTSQLSASSGTIRVPENHNGRDHYEDHQDQCWLISAGDGERISLSFTKFDIQISISTGLCKYDYVYVFDGSSNQDKQLISAACGAESPAEVKSSGREMLIYFHSDKRNGGTGFIAKYQIIQDNLPNSVGEVDRSRPCGQPAVKPKVTKINGGREAVPHSWPWQVRLGEVECGGTIVSPQYVLTAAHCFYATQPTHIVAGSHDKHKPGPLERRYEIADVITHPMYNSSTMDADVALIRLQEDIVFNDHVTAVCLPEADDSPPDVECVATGWGYSGAYKSSFYKPGLRQVELPVYDVITCNQKTWHNGRLTDNMICAGYEDGGKDSCTGDSGGPLVCLDRHHHHHQYTQYGVTSFGVGCARRYKPGVYTNLARFAAWITQHIH